MALTLFLSSVKEMLHRVFHQVVPNDLFQQLRFIGALRVRDLHRFRSGAVTVTLTEPRGQSRR